jgi:hypothetical protein
METSPQAALAHSGAIQEVSMKRILLAAVACVSLLVALPAVSAAHPSSHHVGRDNHPEDRSGHSDRAGDQHRNRDHASQLEHFRAHHMGTAGAAGAVQSFQNGILTIKLADGPTVSGMVTTDTQVSCEAMDRDSVSRDGSSGDHGGSGDDGGGDGSEGGRSGSGR